MKRLSTELIARFKGELELIASCTSEHYIVKQKELRLIISALETAFTQNKKVSKNKARNQYHKQYYNQNREKMNKMNMEYNRKLRRDAKAFRDMEAECQ